MAYDKTIVAVSKSQEGVTNKRNPMTDELPWYWRLLFLLVMLACIPPAPFVSLVLLPVLTAVSEFMWKWERLMEARS